MRSILFLSVVLLGMNTANAAPAAPPDAVFNQVAKQAEQLGYTGYDVLVCLNANNRIVAGGLSFWNTPLRIYVVANGSVIPTTRTSKATETTVHKFKTAQGVEVMLNLSQAPKAILAVGPAENAQLVSCFYRYSGLE